MNALTKVLLFATAALTLSCAAPGGPYGELHYPILRTSHLQGAAVAASGAMTADDLLAQISLPRKAQSGSEAIG